MKKFSVGVYPSFLVAILFLVLVDSIRVPLHHHISVSIQEEANAEVEHEEGHKHQDKGMNDELRMELHSTGSTLPDCSHACGPCFPCKRVMVGYKCSAVESCPVVYRCMCKGKYYHVPSNI